MNEEALKYWIALRAVEDVGCVGFRALLAAFSSPRAVFPHPLGPSRGCRASARKRPLISDPSQSGEWPNGKSPWPHNEGSPS